MELLPWWGFGFLALLCGVLYLVGKIIENKVLKEGNDLEAFSWVVAVVGLLMLYLMLRALGIFNGFK